MPIIYLPFVIYTSVLDAMFQSWGKRPQPHTIIAHEPEQLALPAPALRLSIDRGGI